VGEHAFPRRLNGRHRAVIGFGDGHELRGAATVGVADVEVVADEVQERFVANDAAGELDGVPVAERGLGGSRPLGWWPVTGAAQCVFRCQDGRDAAGKTNFGRAA
jgi:hypothetical protein